jgi:integrase
LISKEELAQNLGLSVATLADWRSQRKGPAYVKVGRQIWYLRDRVKQWLLSQIRETNHGTSEPRGEVAFRFNYDGKEYAGTTGLDATKQNETRALEMEFEYRQALREGRRPSQKIVVRQFSDAAKEFLDWAEGNYREHPNSYDRVATSFASHKEFFGTEPVSLIDAARVEAYKTWRIREHEVRPVTLRHDLHALSKFFGHAIKQRWTRENPVREVDIPSDADAVRMHILIAEEEKDYFKRAQTNKNLYDCGRLIINQGTRPDEVLSLRKEDIDLQRGTLRIAFGKTPAARRTLNLTSESRVILGRRMAGESPWIFPKSKRHPKQRVKRLNSAHDRICAKAKEEGVNFRFVLYDFRHTFATRAAQAGIDLATLAAILGHSSLRAVHKYVHPTAEHKKAAMLRFERAMKAEERKQNRATRPN